MGRKKKTEKKYIFAISGAWYYTPILMWLRIGIASDDYITVCRMCIKNVTVQFYQK